MAQEDQQAVTPEDLPALMARYQEGDADAFEKLYSRLAPRLRRYLRSLARDPGWTEDLLQETFLHLHRARHTYNRGRPLEPWAYAIARHVFLMSRRARIRRGEFDRVDSELIDRQTSPGLEPGIIARDGLRRGLAGLTPGTRRAVVLHHVLGWSFQEIGARLGIRSAAARLRASRGMATLREELSDKGDDHDE